MPDNQSTDLLAANVKHLADCKWFSDLIMISTSDIPAIPFGDGIPLCMLFISPFGNSP
jgi:hypothetical protein